MHLILLFKIGYIVFVVFLYNHTVIPKVFYAQGLITTRSIEIHVFLPLNVSMGGQGEPRAEAPAGAQGRSSSRSPGRKLQPEPRTEAPAGAQDGSSSRSPGQKLQPAGAHDRSSNRNFFITRPRPFAYVFVGYVSFFLYKVSAI